MSKFTWEEYNAIQPDQVENTRVRCYIHKRGDAATFSHLEAGWPKEPNSVGPGKLYKCRATEADRQEGDTLIISTRMTCNEIATWKTEKQCKHYIYTGYYCDAHVEGKR